MRGWRAATLLMSIFLVSGCGRPVHRPLPPESGARPSAPFASPLKTYEVLSRFGPRGGRFHTGLDMRGRRGGGDPVYASRGGRVFRSQVMSGYGNLVEIRHDDGFSTRYAHLRKIAVKKGQTVKAGDAVGTVGSTGRATTAHLHFEILTPAYRFLDPEPLLRRRP